MKAFGLSLIFLFSATLASACSFTPEADRMQPAQDNVSKYEHIFVATVSNTERNQESFDDHTYTFTTARTYKGAHKATMQITSPARSCGSVFGEGQVGLFFLDGDGSTIDESNPQYFYESVAEATAAVDELFGIHKEEKPQKPCTKEYAPVCGAEHVQCVQAPCPPIKRTFPNRCVMENAYAVRFLHNGECPTPEPTPAVEVKSRVDLIQPFYAGVSDYQIISSPFSFEGTTGTGPVWLAFEGQVGVVKLIGKDNQELAWSPLSVVGEWMKAPPHKFSAKLEFQPVGDRATLVFTNEDPSGEGLQESVPVPVIFNPSSEGGPTVGPLENFIEPTTPPPYDNSPREEEVEPELTFWQKTKDFFSGLIAWFF